MSTLPLIAHRRPDAVVAWRGSTPVSVRQFLGEVDHVAGQLPPGQHVLNLCGDRYRFAVALAACIVSGRISLLPSTHTPEMVRQMQRIAPDVFCIVDQDAVNKAGGGVDLPTFGYPESAPMPAANPAAAPTINCPAIDCEQVIALVFTSGSTGMPMPHVKRWGSLVHSVRAEAERLGIGAAHAILGTVPPQHMYGLESTVLMPLQSGAVLHAGHPFYPADICAALASLPRPRVLVTTPYHLRALLKDQATLPAVDQLLSATAPLSQDLAREAETRFGAPLHEIYGCTETGQLASRRTASGLEWHTLADVRLRREGQTLWAEGGHIDSPTGLADVIDLVGDGFVSTTFLLRGRHADQVNIAGKRTSLAYLNHQLNAIPGVQDGVFLLPREDGPDSIHRLTALVVAPGLTPAALTRALRERIDPVFLPRPLLFVEALPRNATGKLPSQITQDLLATLQAQAATGMPA
ncbi:MAG: AMP-binding protein [Thiobacillus sp.]|nr:AMP-binding protein [Thiobacillus sp.]MDP2057894.1 AMP-binding protein [Thiobacillus sp.]